MNQPETITAPRSKAYEITMTALMAAITCILAPLSIPIGPVPDLIHQPGDLPVPVSSRMEKRNDQLSDLSSARTGWPPGILRLHRRSGQTGRSYRWIYHRIYRNGSHCRTGNRQLPQIMVPAYRYDRRNRRVLPFWNHMVLSGRRLHLQSSSRSLRNSLHPGRPGKNDHRHDYWADDKKKNTVITLFVLLLTFMRRISPIFRERSGA